MEFIRKTIKVGNSAGVLLPKSLLGSEVKISVLKRPVDIKKEVLKILQKHLEELQGIYIISLEPGEILAVSTKTKAIITKKNLKITLVPLELIKRDLRENKKLKKKIMKAQPILNRQLLKTLKNL